MELEVKHLAPYLPYETTFEIQIHEMYKDSPKETRVIILNQSNVDLCLAHGKLRLHPLSDIKKEMLNHWYDGVAENEISMVSYSDDTGKAHTVSVSYKMMGDGFTDIICTRNSIQYTDYWIVQKMLENHFDVFGLIDAGLATELSWGFV